MSEVDLQAAQQRYSTVAIPAALVIALALAFQLALGFSMPRTGAASFPSSCTSRWGSRSCCSASRALRGG